MIRVLLVDDHASSREPLALLLDRELDIVVAGQAASLAEARLKFSDVDIALLDLGLPDGSGLELITEFQQSRPDGIVIVLTGQTAPEERAQAVEAGAAGVLHKSA